MLVEDETGDHAWKAMGQPDQIPLLQAQEIESAIYYPASYENLIILKNWILSKDPQSTVFPGVSSQLATKTIGVGARFTTLHWPAVEWAMAQLGIGLTANQNSIPRELVYDVDAMLEGRLGLVPFPFIGCDVPEGHQGQSVQGMSHGAILSKLKTGFHFCRIPWSFNADHQPIGGAYDSREDQLVGGCLFASYITFDLSPELAQTEIPANDHDQAALVEKSIPSHLVKTVRERVGRAGVRLDLQRFNTLLCQVWPAMQKMKRRDEKYAAIRQRHFSNPRARVYVRELSIDELPGITLPETTAVMLAFCEVMQMPVDFVAPAFGFQKNAPYPDNVTLRELVQAQWNICSQFGLSIGFHSGSGKSAENYQILGQVTSGRLEIKTSGRYTYEMGVALSQSTDPNDQALWKDWYDFTRRMAHQGAFSQDPEESSAAREFIEASFPIDQKPSQLFQSPETCAQYLDALDPSPDHMLFFEYNFLYVLAGGESSDKSALGDHSPAGYRQRSRFYSISDQAKLLYAKRVARYLIFLADNAQLVPPSAAQSARETLENTKSYSDFLEGIAPKRTLS